MTDEQIEARAQEIAHEHTAACKNRPAVYAKLGHGKACTKLAKIIAAAMFEARE